MDIRGGDLEVKEIIQVERTVIAAFLELITKLNETAFRPLFRKLFDWAFSGTLAAFSMSVVSSGKCRCFYSQKDHIPSCILVASRPLQG